MKVNLWQGYLIISGPFIQFYKGSSFRKFNTNTFFVVLTGKATSNTFDNEKVLDEATVLKGVNQRSDIGLLSLFEHYDSILVGDNLKHPTFPIWLVCAESHFTVLFGLARGLERTSLADRKPIDLLYYDQLSKVQVRAINYVCVDL